MYLDKMVHRCILLDKTELDVKKLDEVGINPNSTTSSKNPFLLECNDDCDGMWLECVILLGDYKTWDEQEKLQWIG